MEETCCSRELLVFVPLPFLSHLVPAIELASQLTNRRPNLSIIFLLLHLPFDPKAHSYAKSISGSANPGLSFVHLPEPEPKAEPDSTSNAPVSPAQRTSQAIQSQTHLVQRAVAEIMASNSTATLAGFLVDMFCSAMIDVANAFRVPTYSFYITGARILQTFHFHSLIQDSDQQGLQDYSDPNLGFDDISIPGYANPIPVKMLPTSFFDKTGFSWLLHHVRRLRETKGIILRTFMEFEFDTINVLSNDPTLPPIYPAGPMINLQGINSQNDQNEEDETMKIMKWLDDQPVSSVVLLCFGSGGSFGESQVKEIANAVERSGHRFIWSFRSGGNENEKVKRTGPYNHEGLPEGFLERTSGTGIVAPWVPQARVLSHPSVGGFVTHCGWSSVMEGVYLGVPMAVWPMHSDQQMNAFMLVKELEIGVDMKMDYRLDFSNPDPDIVESDRIENGIRELMDVEKGVKMRERVKEMKEKAMVAVLEGGSSYRSMASLIEDIFK